MNKFLKNVLIIVLLATSSCGFKISNNIFFTEFYLESINNTYNKKLDFLIKQGLQSKLLNENAPNKISLEITNIKTKNVNEKNIQNQVTKYEVEVKSDLRVTFLNKLKTYDLSVISKGIYNVDTAHINTKRNHDNLEKFLANENVDEILKKLMNLKDDF